MNDLREAVERAFDQELPLPDIVDRIIVNGHRRRSRRRMTSGLAVVVVAVGSALVVLLPSLLGGSAPGISPAAQAAIRTLAAAASRGPEAPAPPHRYLHVVGREMFGSEIDVIQTWTAHDGLQWLSHSANQNVPPLVTWGENDTSGPSLRFLESLPTTGRGLAAYLNTHVTGSNTKDQAIFKAVGDMLRFGVAPPALRAAAFDVLQRTPHISVRHTRDPFGRRALVVTFTDPTGLSGPSSLLFDPRTAMLIGERDGPGFVVTYTQKIVRSVPRAIRAQAGRVPPRPPAPPPLSQQPSPRPTWSS